MKVGWVLLIKKTQSYHIIYWPEDKAIIYSKNQNKLNDKITDKWVLGFLSYNNGIVIYIKIQRIWCETLNAS